MADRESIEKLLAQIKRERDEAEAEAGHAAEDLVRRASGMVPLSETDGNAVRAAADTFAEVVQRYKQLDQFGTQLMSLLI